MCVCEQRDGGKAEIEKKQCPSITKAARPWQRLRLLIILLPTVCGRVATHSPSKTARFRAKVLRSCQGANHVKCAEQVMERRVSEQCYEKRQKFH